MKAEESPETDNLVTKQLLLSSHAFFTLKRNAEYARLISSFFLSPLSL